MLARSNHSLASVIRCSRMKAELGPYETKAERRERMLKLLAEIQVTKEELRRKYGEFDVDAQIYAAREERDAYLDSLWQQ